MARNKNRELETLLSQFQKFTNKPETFLSVQANVAKTLQGCTKRLYDFAKERETGNVGDALPELIIQNFDEEQIWQEIELQNEPTITDLLAQAARSVACKHISFQTEMVPPSRKRRKKQSLSEDEEQSEEAVSEDDVEGGESVDDEEEKSKDRLRLNSDDDDSDMSDEELELKKMLDKSEGNENDADDDDDGDVDGDGNDDGDETENSGSESDISDSISKSFVSSTKKKVPQVKHAKSSVKKRTTIVDDTFFKLAEMESFLEQEDAKEEKRRRLDAGKQSGDMDDETSSEEEEEDIDVFADIPSDEEEGKRGRDLKYADFFDAQEVVGNEKEKKVKFSELGENEEEASDSQLDLFLSESSQEEVDKETPTGSRDLLGDDSSDGEDVTDILGGVKKRAKSTFETRQERVKEKINELEDMSVAEKPWQLMGEISANRRPENSLLQEDLDFEHTTRQPVAITEETTKDLEDIIKQRIKDKAYDDVERKVKPTEQAFEYKRRIVLDQEKSKFSLAEVYEQEYLKLAETEEKEEIEKPSHEDIRKSMQALCRKLDALSNFHFTPKLAAPEVRIVSNLPSITVEDVQPVSTSDAALLAPEEVQEKKLGELKGETEKTETDKKSERRRKKKRQRIRQKEQEKKQLSKTQSRSGNKQTKEKAMRELEKQSKSSRDITVIKNVKGQQKTGLTSSTKFFTKLQDKVQTQIKSRSGTSKSKKTQKDKSSAKLKL